MLIFTPPVVAATICSWVDENGRTQISDVVPDQYGKSATCSDSKQYELSPEVRQQALERAAKEKAAAEQSAERLKRAPAASAAAIASAPSSAKRPAQVVTESTDCDTWRRLYEESVECFAPYRTTRGTTKAQAYEKCNAIESPDLKCGPARTSPHEQSGR